MITGPHRHQRAEDGQRPCARGQHCKSAATVHEGGQQRREPALGPRPFCDRDRAQIIDCIRDLPDRYTDLGVALRDHRTTGGGPKVSGSVTPAGLLREDVDALMRDILYATEAWYLRVAAVARLSGDHALAGMCSRLAAHPDALLSLPPGWMAWPATHDDVDRFLDAGEHIEARQFPQDGFVWVNRVRCGVDAGLGFLRMESRCRRTLGWTPQHQQLPVPCWGCGYRALLRRDGAAGLEDRAECTHCGEEYVGDRFAYLRRQIEATSRAKQTRAAS
jgi:hypothetical protein